MTHGQRFELLVKLGFAEEIDPINHLAVDLDREAAHGWDWVSSCVEEAVEEIFAGSR